MSRVKRVDLKPGPDGKCEYYNTELKKWCTGYPIDIKEMMESRGGKPPTASLVGPDTEDDALQAEAAKPAEVEAETTEVEQVEAETTEAASPAEVVEAAGEAAAAAEAQAGEVQS